MTESSRREATRILFITCHSPVGEDHGARLRVRHITRQLGKFAKVRLVLVDPYEKFAGVMSSEPNPTVPSEVFNSQPWKIASWGDRIRYELGSGYLNTNKGKVQDEDRRHMLRLIAEHDLVWVHGLRAANGFNIWKWPKSILDIDDIPSERTKSEMLQTWRPDIILRKFRQVCLWKRHERRIFERFDAMAVCSEPDRAHFGNSKRVFVIPNGFDAPSENPVRHPFYPVRVGFIGSLEYPANAKGLRWFLRHVWPRVLKSVPNATLRLVGRGSTNPEWSGAPNVDGLGWVAETDAEIATWSFTIVPVFEGGGTRVKISNAFSRKCPVVSTRLGAYGYDVANDRELLLADSVADFVSACLRMLHDEGVADRLANNAWNSFLEKWTWDSSEARLKQAVRFVLKETGGNHDKIRDQAANGC